MITIKFIETDCLKKITLMRAGGESLCTDSKCFVVQHFVQPLVAAGQKSVCFSGSQ